MNSVVTRYGAALQHFAWVLGAAVVAAVIGLLSGPSVSDSFGPTVAVVVTAVLVPALSAVLKYFRTQEGTTVTVVAKTDDAAK